MEGDNSNTATQGSGNSAPTVVGQSNTSDQTQANDQSQNGAPNGSSRNCCSSDQSEAGEQTASNEGQSNSQSNSATVINTQGNDNVNAPVQVTVIGNNSNEAKQGSYNSAPTYVHQSNTNEQKQINRQDQSQSGGCCWSKSSESGEQSASNEKQESSQSNSATVINTQGNGNLNAPLQTGGGGTTRSLCTSTCGYDSGNSNHVTQGSGNSAPTYISQSNHSQQTQSNSQRQGDPRTGGECCRPKECPPPRYERKPCPPKDEPKPCPPKSEPKQCPPPRCEPKPRPPPCPEPMVRCPYPGQSASNSGQSNSQSNSATIYNTQGNGNLKPVQSSTLGGNSNHVTQGGYNSAPTSAPVEQQLPDPEEHALGRAGRQEGLRDLRTTPTTPPAALGRPAASACIQCAPSPVT